MSLLNQAKMSSLKDKVDGLEEARLEDERREVEAKVEAKPRKRVKKDE